MNYGIDGHAAIATALLFALLIRCAVFAQAPLAIESVSEALTGDTRLAPGSRALVRLTGPVQPGTVTVHVGNRPAGIFSEFGERVYLLLPFDVPQVRQRS